MADDPKLDPKEDPETDPEPEPEDEFTPPTKDEWANTQEALRKANGEAKKYRLENRDLKAKPTDPPKGEEGDAKAAAEAAAKKAQADTDAKWKPRLVSSAARAALLQAGAKPDRVDALCKQVDPDDLDIDDDGKVVGLDAEVDRLKGELPELFGRRKRMGDIDADKDDDGKPRKMTASQAQAAHILGKPVR